MELDELLEECAELTNKIKKLDDFLVENKDFEDRNLLLAQRHSMKTYKDILSIRINNARLVMYTSYLKQMTN